LIETATWPFCILHTVNQQAKKNPKQKLCGGGGGCLLLSLGYSSL
jgi:hypothetical protein